MKTYHNPKKQNFSGNRFFSFLENEKKLVEKLDKSMIYDRLMADGKFSADNNITGISKDGGRIWTF